jgi:carotenoid isomerooxygenase
MKTAFKTEDFSDNTSVSIYPFDKEFFALGEAPLMNGFDPKTLNTLKKVDIQNSLKITTQTAHPFVESDGSLYNMCLLTNDQVRYGIICFPGGSIENAKIVATLPCRWKLNPSYMHSFGITENYFIIVEQPYVISVMSLLAAKIANLPTCTCFKWYPNEQVKINVIERKTGELKFEYYTDTFFFYHIINQYEADDHIMLDISCYKDANSLDEYFTKNLKSKENHVRFMANTRTRPLRFVLPLKYPPLKKHGCLTKIFKRSTLLDENLVTLESSNASAFLNSNNGSIFCNPEILCDIGCEFGRFNNDSYLGKRYKYFYAVCSDKEADCKVSLLKVNTDEKKIASWYEENAHASEPIFVPSPDAKEEDDGVVLSTITWYNDANRLTFLVLNAKDMKEIARSEFSMDNPVPVAFHGWFAPNE